MTAEPFALVVKEGLPGKRTVQLSTGIAIFNLRKESAERITKLLNTAHAAAVKEAVEKAVAEARAKALDDAMMRIYEFRQGLKPAFYAEEACYKNAEALIKGLIEIDEKAAIRARGKA